MSCSSCSITACHRNPKLPSLSTAYNLTHNNAVYFQGSFLPFQDELALVEVQKRRMTPRLAGPSLAFKADVFVYPTHPKPSVCGLYYPGWLALWFSSFLEQQRALKQHVNTQTGWDHFRPALPPGLYPSQHVTDAICLTWRHHKIWSNTLNKSQVLKLQAHSVTWCIKA